VELSKPSPTKKEAWQQLQQKKERDKANKRALTAAEVAELEAQKREQFTDIVEFNASFLSTAPATFQTSSLSSSSTSSTFIASTSASGSFKKTRGRSRESKNSVPDPVSSDLASSSSSAPVTTRSGRAIKEKTKWEPTSAIRRPRGPTLDAAPQPTRKRSKNNLISAEEVEERESQQRRVINTAFIVD